jgi:hypothetical protein
VLPATQLARDRPIAPTWLPDAIRRVIELSLLQKDWDSYGGEPLQSGSVMAFGLLITELGQTIQTQPVISLNGDGGLVLEWENEQASLVYVASADTTAQVYYAEPSGREWEGQAVECVLLEKWLWRASGRAVGDP